MKIHDLAGKPAPLWMLPNIPKLVSAYYTRKPNVSVNSQRVAFGTSGHRGSSLENAFNEDHILAVCQALCEYRGLKNIDGPLFMGMDTHALSEPAHTTAVEVFSAAGVTLMIAKDGGYTPTPVISHAILTYNRSRRGGLADGVVITPSHNPPGDGGFKYNPPAGGPADSETTRAIADRANEILENRLEKIDRMPYEKALKSANVHSYDFMTPYIADLKNVLDMQSIADAGLKLGVDPLGGAAVRFWEPIAEYYGLSIEVVNSAVDPAFAFMPLDKDGKIRMDCSSPFAMRGLIDLKDRFDLAFGNDPDVDRHGIVTRSGGLMNPNHYLAAAVWYLFQNRPEWNRSAAIGKTLVSTAVIDRIARHLGRTLCEVPVGFKWFVDGLIDGALAFGGEESAGASFARRDGTVWTTDKDGILMDLLAAEMTAKTGRDPAEIYRRIEESFGESIYERIDAPANAAQKAVLKNLSAEAITAKELAGEPITAALTRAPGNDAPIGGLKVVAPNGWFAARPSGTEDIYKIYAESFKGRDHLQAIQQQAQSMVDKALAAG